VSAAEAEAAAPAVFIGSLQRGAERSYLAKCGSCGSGYHVAARTMREMRQQGRQPRCPECRWPRDGLINVTPGMQRWAEKAYQQMTPSDRALVALGFGIQRSDLALAASAMR